MRAFFPDHKPHPGRPTRQIQQSYSAVCDAVQKTTVRELTRDLFDGRYRWVEQGTLDPSEGTGPWIAEWQMGPSTEENLLRPWLRVGALR